MRVTFTNPCPTGTIAFSISNTKIKFDTVRGEDVLSPYEGVIHTYRNDNLTIMHDIDGNSWESIIKNVRARVIPGNRVRRGEQIGFTSQDKLVFEVSVGGSNLSNLEDLITRGIDSRSVNIQNPSPNQDDTDNDDTDNDEDGENNNKVETPPKDYKPNLADKDLASKGIMKMLLSPISFAQSALNLKSDKNSLYESNDLIKEEINRIKKLF